MAARTKDDYLELRRRYKPEIVRLAIVAESPPASGKYFYDPAGRRTEALFSALMTRLGISPGTKEEGLREFQRRGWVLVDATYEPVNKSKRRDETILRDYPHLRDDLSRLLPDRSKRPVIVIRDRMRPARAEARGRRLQRRERRSTHLLPLSRQATRFPPRVCGRIGGSH
jgi:hypothetical protein